MNAKNPGYVIKPITGDGYCVIRSFQEALSFCYGKVESLDSLLVELRSEIMKNYDFYSEFSTNDVNKNLTVSWKHHLSTTTKTPLTFFDSTRKRI